MTTIASQITSLTIVYSTVYSCADQRKHQSSASLAFVRGIPRGPVNSLHKGPVTRKMFPFDDVTMNWYWSEVLLHSAVAISHEILKTYIWYEFENHLFRITVVSSRPWANELSLPVAGLYDDVIKWENFPCYWPFVWGIHRSPVKSSNIGQ